MGIKPEQLFELQVNQLEAAQLAADAAWVAAAAAIVQAVAAAAAIGVSVWLTFRSLKHEREVDEAAAKREAAAESAAAERERRAERAAARRHADAEKKAADRLVASQRAMARAQAEDDRQRHNKPIEIVLALCSALEAEIRDAAASFAGEDGHGQFIAGLPDRNPVLVAIAQARQVMMSPDTILALKPLEGWLTNNPRIMGSATEVAGSLNVHAEQLAGLAQKLAQNLQPAAVDADDANGKPRNAAQRRRRAQSGSKLP